MKKDKSKRLKTAPFKHRGKSKFLKIAFFHLGFFYSGGGEKLVLEEAIGLEKLGHKVVVFVPVVDRKRCFPQLIKKAEVKALLPQLPYWLPFKDGILIILSCLLFPLMIWRFKKFDLFLGANQPGVYFAWLAGRVLKKPYFAYLAQPNRLLYPRGIDIEQKMKIKERDYLLLILMRKVFGKLIGWLDRASIREARAIFANGEFAAQSLEEIYSLKPVICPAGCYPLKQEKLNYQVRQQGILKVKGIKIKKPFILLTNRHYPQKKFEYVISAFPFVLKKNNKIRLVITGKPTRYTQYLKTLVRQLGLEKRVLFLGLVFENDLKKLYQQAAVYVYSSPEEDFGMGVIEAMAAGTPVVAWDYGGPRFIIENNKTGLLAKPYVVEDFAKKIEKLLTEFKLAQEIGKEANKRAREKYSYQLHCKLLEEFFLKAECIN